MTPVALMGKLDRYSMKAYRNTSAVTGSDGVALLSVQRQALRIDTLDGVVFIFQQFLGQYLPKSA
jgi:hypothetical protein